MSINIYNTLTRKKEEFIPQVPSEVKIYTCGVTVYDYCHIGHARSLYIFDLIKRYLEYLGFKVKFVRNITDIDDKIINKAKELGIPWQDVSKKFTQSYHNDLKALGIDIAEMEPKATENIDDMIKHIKGLIEKGYAYKSGSNVYFNVRKFKDYGKLSGQSLDQMLVGVRKEPGEGKIDPLDFALWKSFKEGEPAWDSPWGKGRPGWHIECSVMSMKYLGVLTLDIHACGMDLIFPHHENEIAQSEALTGKEFAKYWIHHGLLTINGQKMAKSLGNFITIKDLLEKYNPDILKLFFLTANYGSPIDFTWEKIEDAAGVLKGIENFFERVSQLKDVTVEDDPDELIKIEGVKEQFISSMDNDFNTPEALACVIELKDLGNSFISYGKSGLAISTKQVVEELLEILNIKPSLEVKVSDEEYMEDSILSLIRKRDLARQRKDFQEADHIRKLLEEKGIILEDTKDGTIWIRK